MKLKHKISIFILSFLILTPIISIMAAYTTSYVDGGNYQWVRGTGVPSGGYQNVRSTLSGYGKSKRTSIARRDNSTGTINTYYSGWQSATTLSASLNRSEYAGYDPGRIIFTFDWYTRSP